MLRKRNKMDSNRHDHTTTDEKDSGKSSAFFWFLIAVVVVPFALVIIGMGYNLVVSSRELSEFQTFTVAVLSALVTAVGGLIAKNAYDKNKSEAARMKHEEVLETIRLQTNGRLHKRDDLAEKQDQVIALLLKERAIINRSTEVKNDGTDTVIQNTTKAILVEDNSEDITVLLAEIKEQREELKKKYRPLYPKDDQ